MPGNWYLRRVVDRSLIRCQKISYAKGKSHIIAKLDGTFKPPTAAKEVEVTDLQHSIFNAPVPGQPGSVTAPAKSSSLPPKPPGGGDQPMPDVGATETRGVKRPREEELEEESDQDVAMEEESDED